MAFMGVPKYFIGFFLLFTCGYLSNSVFSDTYHYIYLLSNRDNDLYMTELNDEAIDLLEEHFPDISIDYKNKKAVLHGSIRKCVNVLGTLGYRIFHYPVKPNLPEWILEKKISSEDFSNDLDDENNIQTFEAITKRPE